MANFFQRHRNGFIMMGSKYKFIILLILFGLIYLCSYRRFAYKCDSENFSILLPEPKQNSWSKKTITVEDIVKCHDVELKTSIKQRGDFWVLYNFVPAKKSFKCGESITLTTPADYRFLDNILPLVDRWRGPISIALYAPGFDFHNTVKSIAYLRQCTKSLVKDLVSFHIFFNATHLPKSEKPLIEAYEDTYNCSSGPPYENIQDGDLYKIQNNLLYPINVARNIAWEAAQTYFVFPSDIELYPTRNLIQQFLSLVRRSPSLFISNQKNVFVLPVFEILANQTVPENKQTLQNMVQTKMAFWFHVKICALCHNIPKGDKWLKEQDTKKLDVFTVAKRHNQFAYWEPFYIGTKNEPLFDERLSWEGQGNKISQAYSLCILDYNFNILNNAFLVHKPGVKKKKVQLQKFGGLVRKTDKFLLVLQQELVQLHGTTPKCYISYLQRLLEKKAKKANSNNT